MHSKQILLVEINVQFNGDKTEFFQDSVLQIEKYEIYKI
jgi:hypothetical protein